jgi:hypothetical protein
MALFIDGPPSNIQDLIHQDSGLPDVCRTEQIDAGIKLRLAYEAVSSELSILFEDQHTFTSFYYGQSKLRIDHVAITPSLKTWHVFATLAAVYRDAYFTQLNDRYQAKWKEYQSLAQATKQHLRSLGVGLVLNPLPRPQAPTLTLVPASESGGTFYISVTTINAEGEESSCSSTESLEQPAGNALSVQINVAAINVQGWNAYIGDSPSRVYLQNDRPLPPSDSWTFYPSSPGSSKRSPGDGQRPNLVRALPRLLQRG